MKKYNTFRKTTNKHSPINERLYFNHQIYKPIKYSYKTKFLLSVYTDGKKQPFKNIFNRRAFTGWNHYTSPTARKLEKHLII